MSDNPLQSVSNYLVPATGSTSAAPFSKVLKKGITQTIDFNNYEIDGVPFRPSGAFVDNTKSDRPLRFTINQLGFSFEIPAGGTAAFPYPAPQNHTINISGGNDDESDTSVVFVFVDYPVIPSTVSQNAPAPNPDDNGGDGGGSSVDLSTIENSLVGIGDMVASSSITIADLPRMFSGTIDALTNSFPEDTTRYFGYSENGRTADYTEQTILDGDFNRKKTIYCNSARFYSDEKFIAVFEVKDQYGQTKNSEYIAFPKEGKWFVEVPFVPPRHTNMALSYLSRVTDQPNGNITIFCQFM